MGSERRAPYENETIPDNLQVAWDVDVGSGMVAGLLLTDSVLFAGTTNRQLFAFAMGTGDKYWDQRLEAELASDIVRSGGVLYVTTSEQRGRVHARTTTRGRKRWESDIGPSRFSPLLDGGILYVATDRGWLYALRADDGQRIWRMRVPGTIASLPVNHDDAVIVVSMQDTIYRLSKRDGSIVTRHFVNHRLSALPALSGDTLVLATHSGNVLAFNARTLNELWQVDTHAPVLAAPAFARDGAIHILGRDANIWKIANGRATRVATLGGSATTSFTLARDRYVVGKMDGSVQVVTLDGKVVSEHKFNESIAAPIAVGGGALYVPLRRGRIVKLR